MKAVPLSSDGSRLDAEVDMTIFFEHLFLSAALSELVYVLYHLTQDFREREGAKNADGTREDPTLDKFEAEIARYKATQEEVQVNTHTHKHALFRRKLAHWNKALCVEVL